MTWSKWPVRKCADLIVEALCRREAGLRPERP
jgi:hypothetical protein